MYISKSLFRCVAVLGLIGVMLMASPGTSKGQLLVDSDFEASADSAALRANTGQGWYESRSDVPTLLTLDIATDIGGNNTKKAKFTASSTDNAYLTQAFSPIQTGTFYAQWDIYVDSITNLNHYPADPDRGGWMLIGDNTNPQPDPRTGPNSDDGERFVYLGFAKPGGGTTGTMDLVARDGNDEWDAFTTVAADLSLDQWYTIKVHCNLTAGIYDVYVNGVFRQTVTSRNAKTQVTHVSFATWDDGAATFYVDNVTATFCPGDTNASGARDGSDLARIIQSFGISQGQPNYDPFTDLNGSNNVDLADLTTFAGVFGQTCQ